MTRPSSITRRDTFRLLGAGAVTSLLAPGDSILHAQPAAAAAPDAVQGGGIYRFKVGELECAIVSDGGFTARPGDLFPEAGDEDIADATDKAFIAPGMLPVSINTLLLRAGNAIVLIDTGTGGAMGPTTGKLIENLARLNVAPDDVTHVIITHAHPDHIGGLSADGRLGFARARVIISEAEHAFWTQASPTFPGSTLLNDEMKQMMTRAAQGGLTAAADNLDQKKPGDAIVEGISLVDAAGHTPGMVAVRIESGDASLLYIADTLNVAPIQLQHPDWKVLFDTDPVAAAATRKRLLDEIAAQRTLVAGSHLSFPALGHIGRDGREAYRWFPAAWQW